MVLKPLGKAHQQTADIREFGLSQGIAPADVHLNDTLHGNAEGLTPDDIKVTRDPWALYLSIKGTQDKLTITDWFSLDSAKVERVVFGEGTVWGWNRQKCGKRNGIRQKSANDLKWEKTA